MARHPGSKQITKAAAQDALRIARGISQPGQSKAQTRLIARGIQKGIEQYKKQQSSKARELDRKLKRLDRQAEESKTNEPEIREVVRYQLSWLPWILLAASWLGFVAYLLWVYLRD